MAFSRTFELFNLVRSERWLGNGFQVMGIRNFLNDKWGALQGKPKVKLHVEFNHVQKTEEEVQKILHGFKVVSAEHRGVHTWIVHVRTKLNAVDIIAVLSKRTEIRFVAVTSPSTS